MMTRLSTDSMFRNRFETSPPFLPLVPEVFVVRVRTLQNEGRARRQWLT